jgi:hypothetical protein
MKIKYLQQAKPQLKIDLGLDKVALDGGSKLVMSASKKIHNHLCFFGVSVLTLRSYLEKKLMLHTIKVAKYFNINLLI